MKALGVGSLVVVAVIALALYGREQRQRGRAEAQVAALEQLNDSLKQVQARVEVVYRTDTVRLWRTLARYDTARVTDTLTRNDTVFVPRAVADEAVAACTATVLTCEQRVGVRDTRIRVLEQTIRVMPKPRSAFWRWTERGLIAYGSFQLGQLAAKR